MAGRINDPATGGTTDYYGIHVRHPRRQEEPALIDVDDLSAALKLTPEEFDVMARDMMDREKALAKKNKTKNSLLDMRFSRDSIGGNLALMQRLTVVGPEGKPVRLMGWDVYLPNGAGLMIRVVCDQEVPNAESEVINLVKTLRTK